MSRTLLVTLPIVVAILFVMALIAEVFVKDMARPPTLFGYLIITTLTTSLLATVIVERLDGRMLS